MPDFFSLSPFLISMEMMIDTLITALLIDLPRAVTRRLRHAAALKYVARSIALLSMLPSRLDLSASRPLRVSPL